MSTHPTESSDSAAIERFLAGRTFAVAGASTNREKYGNKVVRAFQQAGREVWPINPRADVIEEIKCYPDLASLPSTPHGLSIITPPKITTEIVREAIAMGIKHIWMQPGAESEEAFELSAKAGIDCIGGGPCLLVVIGYREH